MTGSNNWRFVETCTGSGAVTLHLLGMTVPFLPFVGNKWNFAPEIKALIGAGFPTSLWLNEPGPWRFVWQTLAQRGPNGFCEIAQAIDRMAKSFPQDRPPYYMWEKTWDIFRGRAPYPEDIAEAAACHLVYLAGSYNCTERGGYRAPVSTRYELMKPAFTPSLPTLCTRLMQMARLPWPEDITVTTERAQDLVITPSPPASYTIVYIDPPYAKTESFYKVGLKCFPREDVIKVCTRFAESDNTVVMLSEGEVIEELLQDGFGAIPLEGQRVKKNWKPGVSQYREWVHISAQRPATIEFEENKSANDQEKEQNK